MSQTSILADDSTIHNFISKICSPLYFSEPARKNIANFITGASQKGYRGKKRTALYIRKALRLHLKISRLILRKKMFA